MSAPHGRGKEVSGRDELEGGKLVPTEEKKEE